MSGLETLPPDQRAVLQLILTQGRGYGDLASVLRIDVEAVRTRALAGVDALGADGAGALPPERRARIADYLLGQQDEGERIVTLAQLAESAAATDWAQGLHAQLAPLAREPLPGVPGGPSENGAAVAHEAAPVEAPDLPPAPPAPVRVAAVALGGEPPRPGDPAPRPSRLGGALLLGGVGVVAVVLAIVLLSGGGDHPAHTPAAAAATTSTAARSSTAAQPATTPTTSTQPSGRIVGQVNLTATPAGGQAIGIGLVQQSGRALTLAVEAQKLPANGRQDIYAAWLQGPAGPKLLGFVPNQVGASGTFTVSARLPANAKGFDRVLITREAIARGTATPTPKQPGVTILSGPLQLP